MPGKSNAALRIKNDLHCQRAEARGDARTEYPVEGTPGLGLRVSPDGAKAWTFRYRRQSDGKLRRLAFGPYPAVGLKEARERARVARNAISDGDDPAGDKQARRQAVTLADLAEAWADRKAEQGRAPSYVANQRARLTRLPAWILEMKAGEIERVHLTRALTDASRRGKAEANAVHSALSAVMRWALGEGLTDRDPSAGVRKRFASEARARVLSNSELPILWRGIDILPASDGSKLAMRVLLATAQRPAEVCSLRVADVALGALHPQMTISRAVTKNGVEHIVPLPPLAAELLGKAIDSAGGSEWVFPAPSGDGHMDPHALSRIIVRARAADVADGKALGLAHFTVYDFRRTAATYLGNQGHPNEFIALVLNHLSTARGTVTGRHYNHASYLAQKRQLLTEWNGHLEALFGIARDGGNVLPLNQIARA